MVWRIYGWLRVLAWFIVTKRRVAAVRCGAAGGGGGGVWNGWLATRDITKMECIINSPRPEDPKYSEL